MNDLIKKFYNQYEYQQDDLEILLYGHAVFIFNVSVSLFVFLEGILLDSVVFTTLWILMFVILRIHLGGYHCQSKIRCFLTTNTVYLLTYLINIYFGYVQWYILILFMISTGIFLKKFQYVKRKKKVLTIIIVELLCGLLYEVCFVPAILSIIENVFSFVVCKGV